VTLKYKAKRGRSLQSRSAELTLLVRHLEGLRDADPPLDVTAAPRWAALVREAADPASAAGLSRAEDEIDAFVCAYIAAYYWTHGTARCRVVGDLASGYIVTPVDHHHARCLDTRALTPPDATPPSVVRREVEVVDAFCRWLDAEGWRVEPEVEFADAFAERDGERLNVEAKGVTASPGLDLDTLYGQLLRRMPAEDDLSARFAVVVPEEASEAALRVPPRVRALLRLDVYTVDAAGVVRRL
jgi:hypothetical protein